MTAVEGLLAGGNFAESQSRAGHHEMSIQYSVVLRAEQRELTFMTKKLSQ